ncbi:MAG: GxxExxY protein [Chloroflexi bacterium]|nr:GxxExxY protein [Chloroflexota bacterium]
MTDLLLKDAVFAIIGAAIEVHRTLGHGFLEGVYQEALEIELVAKGIPFESQKPLAISYKGHRLAKSYVADYLCYGQIIVEIKALEQMSGIEEGQLLNHLRASGMKVGLLINFGRPGKLDWKRFVW